MGNILKDYILWDLKYEGFNINDSKNIFLNNSSLVINFENKQLKYSFKENHRLRLDKLVKQLNNLLK